MQAFRHKRQSCFFSTANHTFILSDFGGLYSNLICFSTVMMDISCLALPLDSFLTMFFGPSHVLGIPSFERKEAFQFPEIN